MPSLGTGMSGFGQQLADLIGGLLGSSDNASAAADKINPHSAIDEAAQGDPPVDEAHADEAKQGGKSNPDEEPDPDAVDESAKPGEQPLPPPEPAPTQAPPPPEPAPPIPPPAAEGQAVERTPCEIAADELPQVGE